MTEIKFYLALIVRQLHWIILVVALGTGAAIWIAGSLPATYRAQATLLAEAEQIPDELAASTVRTDANEQIQIIRQRVLTRDVLIEMANRMDVYADRRAAGQPRLDGDAIVQDMRDRLVIRNEASGPARRGVTQATILTVSFTAPSAQLAANVANEMTTLMLRENVALRTAAARQTLEFFEQEVSRLDQEMSRRSAAILEFKQSNLNALPDALDFTRSQVTVLQERLFQMERLETELADRRDQLERLRALAPEMLTAAPNRAQTPEARQLQSLQQERASQLVVLAPDHPRIRVLDTQIAQLESVVAQQAVSGGLADPQTMANPQLTAFEIQMADLDRQRTAIAAQKVRVQAELERLAVVLSEIPANTVVLETLERDYAAIEAQYNRAVAARARAETGDTIEALARGQRLSIVEPATPPRRPASPNRVLIAGGGFAASLLLGLGTVLALNLMKPVIRRPADLVGGLGITPFATLPYMKTRAEILRRRIMLWGASTTVLVLIAVGIWFLDSQVMPIDQLLARLRAHIG